MTLLVVALSVLVGVSLGLLGGGGSILMVPILVIVADMDPKAAIATSLLVVGATAAVGAVQHFRSGRVELRTGLLFGGAGMVGAYLGGRLAAFIPGDWLLVAFGIMMAVTAVAMLRGRRGGAEADGAQDGGADGRDAGSGDVGAGSGPPTGDGHTSRPPARRHFGRIVVDGVAVGAVTGLVGAGGGFLVVPALVLLGGLSMPVAVGTSLLVIAMKSAAGLAGYLASVSLDWPLALAVTAAAIAGSFIGTRLVDRTNPALLRRGFGWFVVAAAILVLAQQVPSAWTQGLPGPALAWAAIPITVVAIVAFFDLRSHPGRDGGGPSDPGAGPRTMTPAGTESAP